MPFHERLKRRTITLLTDLQADLRAAATNHTRNRWPISVPGAMTTGFIGTAAGWVSWISVMMAFLAGILVEFIGLSHVIRQRAEGGKASGPTQLGCHAGEREDARDQYPIQPAGARLGCREQSRGPCAQLLNSDSGSWRRACC